MRFSFDRSIVHAIAHRPWEMPNRPWLMKLICHDLLFAHWAVDPRLLAPLLPEGLTLDLHGGRAWLSVVPFHMTNVSLRGVPPLPAISSFAQVNLRTYVHVDDRPGVYFFSLDADSRLASHLSALFGLPFHSATIRTVPLGAAVQYESRRDNGELAAEVRVTYVPKGTPCPAPAGSLDYFLTERYCLYGMHDLFGLFRIDVHHRPWQLQAADVCTDRNTLGDTIGVALRQEPVALHFAKRQDMIVWPPERVTARDRLEIPFAQRYEADFGYHSSRIATRPT